jgi:hypothetical protein
MESIASMQDSHIRYEDVPNIVRVLLVLAGGEEALWLR